MEFMKDNGISIAYTQSGKGNPVFFIHGLGGDTKIVGVKEFSLILSLYLSLPMLYFSKLMVPIIKSQYKRWPLAQKHMVRVFENLRSREVILQRLAINRANHTPLLTRINCTVLGMVGGDVRRMC